MERRVLRRAAEEALITSMRQRTDDVPPAQLGATDQGFEYDWGDPDDTGATYDHEPDTEPIPVVDDLVPDQADDYAWDDHDEARADTDSIEVPSEPVDLYALVPDQLDDHEWQDDGGEVPADGDGVPSDGIEAPDSLQESDDYRWEDHNDLPPDPVEVRPLRARPLAAGGIADSIVGMQMPEYRPQTWLRTKQAVTGLAAAAAVVAVVCGAWLVLRSPSTTADQSTTELPTAEPAPAGAPPAPNSVEPRVSAPLLPPAPPPPPPPPPPTAEPVNSGPQPQYSEPRRTAPTQAEKPEIGVTRTPAIRAPMSVAPVPRPVPGSDSNTPGDAPKRRSGGGGCFGWC